MLAMEGELALGNKGFEILAGNCIGGACSGCDSNQARGRCCGSGS
jgi:hypothetical protein